MRSDIELWKDVRRQELTGELSQRAAIWQYGLGWHTLNKIFTHDAPPAIAARIPDWLTSAFPASGEFQQPISRARFLKWITNRPVFRNAPVVAIARLEDWEL